MADTPTSLSLVTLAQEYRGDVVRQINRKVVALKMLPIRAGAGKNVAWVSEADGALAENYSEGADAANFGGDAQAPLTLNWGLNRSNFHVTKLAMDAAATSSSPLGNRSLWARQLVNASAKLAALFETQIFSGAGTGTLVCGLDVAIGSATNTYAGIDRTVGANAYWKPTVVDAGAAPPTLALIRDDIRKIYEACGENPDFALCTPTVFNEIVGLFDATRRIVQFDTARGKIKLDAGYEGVEVDGCVFVKAKDATAGSIYYCNSDAMHIEYLPTARERMLMSLGMLNVQADDGFGAVPLGFDYEMLAKTGPSDKAQVLGQLQLVVERPNACGVRKNVG